MQDKTPHNGSAPVSQWLESEIALLHELAPRKARKAELRRLFPDRSLASIRVRLAIVRRELGISTPAARPLRKRVTMLDPDDPGLPSAYPKNWAKACAIANARYEAALRAAAA